MLKPSRSNYVLSAEIAGSENDISTVLLGVRKMRLLLWKAHKNQVLTNSFKSLGPDGSEALNIHLDFSIT